MNGGERLYTQVDVFDLTIEAALVLMLFPLKVEANMFIWRDGLAVTKTFLVT